ncbi:MAG: helix-turn-helix transcriptional regulator [Eubacteriales bacterium]|nr:helix-turn-helix transcriptional regulator [bacterium]MDY2791929.1 helix-turn-helix transcriptional regulator [Eubacteriales bacterium]
MKSTNRLTEWLRRVYSRLQLFEVYLATYLLLLAATVLCIVPVVRRASASMRETCLQQQQHALDRSASLLEGQLRTLTMLPISFNDWQSYMELRLLAQENLASRNDYDLSKLQQVLSKQFALLDVRSYGFLLFTRNRSAVSTLHFSKQAGTLFGLDLSCDLSAAELEEKCANLPEGLTLLPLRHVSISRQAPQSGLLALYRPVQESAVFGMVVQAGELKKALFSASMPTDAALRLTDAQGKTLFELGAPEEVEKPVVLDSPIYLTTQLTLTLSVSEASLRALVKPFALLNGAYLAAAICLGVIMSVLFSGANLLPIRQLLRRVAGREDTRGARNEYHALGRAMDRSASENSRLRAQMIEADRLLSRSLFMRFLYQDYYPSADRRLAEKYLPQLGAPNRLVCLRVSGEGADEDRAAFLVSGRFAELLGELGPYTQTGSSDFALLVREDGQALPRLTRFAAQAGEEAQAFGLRLCVGVSDVFTSVTALHTAFLRARLALRPTADGELSVYAQEGGEEFDGMKMADLSRLQHLLIACDAEKALAQLRSLLQNARSSSDSVRETQRIFTLVVFLLRSVCGEMNLSVDPELMLAAESDERSLEACIRAVTDELCRRSSAPETRLIGQLRAYVEENYMDPSLSMDSIAEHFGVSKSYLYRVAREGLNETLVERIERVRMRHAAQLLCEGALSVKDVATACGYNSANTFYKVYRKHFQAAPHTARAGGSSRPPEQ